jgi:hypothetical protein
MNRRCPPIGRGERQDIGDLITSIVGFDSSGQDRRKLAQKIIYAQVMLAKLGFSIGGRAPFGFRRWLVEADGTCVRQLEDGERVRKHGHHVAWMQGPTEELNLIRRILDLLKKKPATQVAKILNEEGIPSPDAGRHRTDSGVRHQVSGRWHAPTINNIARRQLLSAIVQTGIRSMGDQLRFTPDGPRTLEDSDFREQDGKPKVVRNPDDDCVRANAHFDSLIDPIEHAELLKTLDGRSGNQKGIPRSKDPANNPLGGRIFDMNCGWLMYRIPYGESFRYKCGHYQQTHGQECDHNWVEGPASARFVLSTIRQRLLHPHVWSRFEARIRELACAEEPPGKPEPVKNKRQELSSLQENIRTAEKNLALAKSENHFAAISKVLDDLALKEKALRAEIAKLEQRPTGSRDLEREIEQALLTGRMLRRLADAGREDFLSAREAFHGLNAKLFLQFKKVQRGKRTLNKIAGGHVTIGIAQPPVTLYEGPTGRRKLKSPVRTSSIGPVNRNDVTLKPPVTSSEEGESLGNQSRGDWI